METAGDRDVVTPRHHPSCTNDPLTAGLLGIRTIGFGVGEEHKAHQVDEPVTMGSIAAGVRRSRALAVHLVS